MIPDPCPPEVLRVENLATHFFTRDGVIRAVDGISWSVREGETLAIVGETGCGKSVAALSILRLIATPPGRIVGGAVRYRGENLLEKSEREMRAIQGDRISMIFQEPLSSLNPVLSVGRQIAEPLVVHRGLSRSQALDKAVEMLELVQIPEPALRVGDFPHQLSGGMRQRVMIAMALSCQPQLLIADEPTTALDVTVQAQILEIMRDLKQRLGTAIVLITHDLGVVADMAQRVVVMYAGLKVEEAPVREIFRSPRHPYTRGLMEAIPRIGSSGGPPRSKRLAEIPGMVPVLRGERSAGCAFAPRCGAADGRCASETPALRHIQDGHVVACHKAA